MLKIEKNKSVEIHYVKKETFFSREMVTALSLAFFLHVSTFAFIHIQPLIRNTSDRILPKIAVDTSVDFSKASAAIADSDGPSRKHIPLPPRTTPGMPSPPIINIEEYFPSFNLAEYTPLPLPSFPIAMSTPKTVESKSLSVQLCGPAAESCFLDASFQDELIAKIPPGAFLARCEVRIDSKTGKIVWSHFSQNDQAITELTKEVISSVTLAVKKPVDYLLSGEIELIARNEKL